MLVSKIKNSFCMYFVLNVDHMNTYAVQCTTVMCNSNYKKERTGELFFCAAIFCPWLCAISRLQRLIVQGYVFMVRVLTANDPSVVTINKPRRILYVVKPWISHIVQKIRYIWTCWKKWHFNDFGQKSYRNKKKPYVLWQYRLLTHFPRTRTNNQCPQRTRNQHKRIMCSEPIQG